MPKVTKHNTHVNNPYTTAASSTSYTFEFGKHKGESVTEVARSDYGYLAWCLDSGVAQKYTGLRAAIEALKTSRLDSNTPSKPQTHANLKSKFPPWLWKACNDVIAGYHSEDDEMYGPSQSYANREREQRLATAVRSKFVSRFPERTETPLPPSPHIDNLRKILAQAPNRKNLRDEDIYKGGGYEDSVREVEGIEISTNSFPEGAVSFDWSEEYKTKILEAMEEIIKHHGEDYWKVLRWEIHDTFAACVAGLEYCNDRRDKYWVDHAEYWLRDRYGGRFHLS